MRTTLLALLLALSAPASAAEPGEAAPELALPDAEGTVHRLSDQRGSVAVINFWASWCGPCLTELPLLESARTQLPGVVVTLVNLDRQRGPALGALRRIEHGMRSLFDPKGEAAAVWNPPALPSTWVIAPDGTVGFVHKGAIEEADLPAFLDRVRALEAPK